MKKVTQILIFAFISVVTVSTAKAQTYDPYDVQVINNLIKNNGLKATPDAPETWPTGGYGPFQIQWTKETPKKISYLGISYCSLKGDVSVAGLTKMTSLDCSDNQMDRLDATNCSPLTYINLISCRIFEINLTGVRHEIDISDFQRVRFTLYKNGNGTYSLPINLNEPTFYEMEYDEYHEPLFNTISTAITYKNGILEGSDNTVSSCLFRIKPIGYDYPNCLEGAIVFTYSEEPMGINTPDKEGLKIYFNSDNDTLFIDCDTSTSISNHFIVKLYDMLGKEVLTRNTNCNDGINISRLAKGSYIVNVLSDGKIIHNSKIVK